MVVLRCVRPVRHLAVDDPRAHRPLATRKDAFTAPGPARFLWCWAILPPLVFSLSDGKHHHYLLQCIAPWAVLSVFGARAIWQVYHERVPRWLQDPLIPTAACGLCAVAALVAFGHKLPGGRPVALAVGAFVPLRGVRRVSRSLASADPRVAFGGVLAVVVACYAAWTPYQAAHLEEYREDAVFLRAAETMSRPMTRSSSSGTGSARSKPSGCSTTPSGPAC